MKHPKRRHEEVDPNPMTLPVKFQRPPTLAEQIARFLGQHERHLASQGVESPDEADDFGDDDEDEPSSPHELVKDDLLNREIPRFEKEHLDKQRAQFDAQLHRKQRDDKAARIAAEIAAANLEKKRLAALRKNKSDESPDGDE